MLRQSGSRAGATLLGLLAVSPALAEPPRPPAVTRPVSSPASPALPAPVASPISAPSPGSGPAPKPAPVLAIPEPVKLSTDPLPTLGPATFVATMNAAERYRRIAEAGGWQPVPAAASSVKPNGHDASVGPLRARLAATGDLAADLASGDVLDEPVAAALRRFQDRHGLPETGLVGPRTLAVLNVPAATRIRQLEASAARLIGSTFPFGERYVAVNIPSATVEAVQGGQVQRRYVAIVGKTDRPSPTIAARIQNVNFNPTWTVPTSLIKKDIIPHMRKDAGYLAKMRIRILDGQGGEVDPATIDWATERAANYTLRQDPGPENSLGEVRIDMPNKLAVYMHDTPTKRLFARSTRLNSSGCVRVAGVRDLAQWLLDGQAGPAGPGSAWGQSEIAAAIATGQRQDVKVLKQVPVIWTYLTGYATADGIVHFRDDAYGLDSPVAAPPAAAPVEGLTIEQLVTGSIAPRR